MGSDVNMMEWGSVPVSATIPELISHLRSSFLPAEFQNVTKILVDREDRLKEQSIKLGEKSEAFENEKDVLFLENQKLTIELKKKQKEVDALRKETVEYKDQIRVLNSEKRRVRISALEDELKIKEKEIDALKKKNADQYEKKEAELRVYKKQSADLHVRVLKLEKTAEELMSSPGSSSLDLETKQKTNCTPENNKPPLFCEKGENKEKSEPKIKEIIQLDDDDDDVKCISTKRKRDSNEIKTEYDTNSQNPQTTPTHPPGFTPHVEKPDPKNLISSLNTPTKKSDPNIIKNIDNAYKSLLVLAKTKNSPISQTKVEKQKWESKDDMIEEFDKNDEVCMNAICALFRQSRVLPVFDKSRITQLAELLTEGDPQQKVKKTVSELNRFDVDDCRMFARKYANQIFNIYKKKEDPFFTIRS